MINGDALQHRWKTYLEGALPTPFSRGDGDCCAFAAGWASCVSQQAAGLPRFASDDEAHDYLVTEGGMEEAVHRFLSPLGFRLCWGVGDSAYGIVCFSSDHPTFPEGVGVLINGRIATRAEGRSGVTWVRVSQVKKGAIWNHPNIVKAWV
jgi:hypothetical protein